jgi:DNA polymerase III delta prime subunit
MSRIQKATKKKSKLRILLEGASGSGKTLSALLIAKVFGRAVVIDTEKGSASLYADHPLLKGYEFDVLELEAPYTPERYIEAIKECEDAGCDVIIVDSLSQEWNGEGGCLEIQNKLGGRFQDWAKVTPRHTKFIESILQSKCHIIATCRSKQGYVVDENTRKVTKVGMDPQQRDGLDFEMTTVFNLNENHMAEAKKDRTSLFDGKEHVISEKTGEIFLNWLNSGVEPTPPEQPKASPQFLTAMEQLKEKVGEDKYNDFLLSHKITKLESVIDKDVQTKLYKGLKALVERK